MVMIHSTATQWQHKFRVEIIMEKGQINLSGGQSGLDEFYDATGKPNNIYPKEFYSQYGVDVTFSEFDVS